MSVHIPAAMELQVVVVADIGPALTHLANRVMCFLETDPMPMSKADFAALIDGAKEDLKSLMTKEHQEVLDAVAAGQVSDTVPDEIVDKVKSFIADVTTGVSAIYDASSTGGTGTGTTPTPTDTGTGTTTPTPTDTGTGAGPVAQPPVDTGTGTVVPTPETPPGDGTPQPPATTNDTGTPVPSSVAP